MTDFISEITSRAPAEIITDGIMPVHPDDPFAGIQGTPVVTAKPVQPVPPSIVRMAQEVLNGITLDDGTVTHTKRYTFPAGQEALRDAFVRNMRNAGAWTEPPSTVTVTVNPDGIDGGDMTVSWRAGRKRAKRQVKIAA